MTEILDVGPRDAETLAVLWLAQLYTTANTRRPGDPLPFLLVEEVLSDENIEESTADYVVQVRILCDKAGGEDAARDVKDKVHRRMLLLARTLEISGSFDGMKVFQSPRRVKYENDKVIAYTARYQFMQTYD